MFSRTPRGRKAVSTDANGDSYCTAAYLVQQASLQYRTEWLWCLIIGFHALILTMGKNN